MTICRLDCLAALLPILAGCTVHLSSCAYPVRRAGWMPEPNPPAAVLAEFERQVSARDAWFRRPDGSLLACSRYDARRDDCGLGAIRFPLRNDRYDEAEVAICSYDRPSRRQISQGESFNAGEHR